MKSRELLGGENNPSSCPQEKGKRQEVGREKEEVGTGLQGLGMGTGGTLFRGDLQVQVMQKSIKEARQSLPLAEGGGGTT